MEDAAARLLAVLEQRAEKRRPAGGHERPAEIQQSRTYVPAYPGENGREASAKNGSAALKPPGQLTPQREECGDHTLEGGNGRGLGGGQTDFQTVRFSYGSMEAACPARGDFHTAERTRCTPEDE